MSDHTLLLLLAATQVGSGISIWSLLRRLSAQTRSVKTCLDFMWPEVAEALELGRAQKVALKGDGS